MRFLHLCALILFTACSNGAKDEANISDALNYLGIVNGEAIIVLDKEIETNEADYVIIWTCELQNIEIDPLEFKTPKGTWKNEFGKIIFEPLSTELKKGRFYTAYILQNKTSHLIIKYYHN